MKELLEECFRAVLKGERDRARQLATRVLEEGHDILEVIERGFSSGIREAGRLWEAGEYFLPELAFSAEAMKAAMDVLQPALRERSAQRKSKGTVIIATVQGDIHDIGKTLVATMLAANGYDVVDLGADVPHERFLEKASEHNAAFVCMSALLTTTMAGQRDVIALLEKSKLRDSVKVVVGGAPTSAAWAKDIGADAHAANAIEAVQALDALVSGQ